MDTELRSNFAAVKSNCKTSGQRKAYNKLISTFAHYGSTKDVIKNSKLPLTDITFLRDHDKDNPDIADFKFNGILYGLEYSSLEYNCAHLYRLDENVSAGETKFKNKPNAMYINLMDFDRALQVLDNNL